MDGRWPNYIHHIYIHVILYVYMPSKFNKNDQQTLFEDWICKRSLLHVRNASVQIAECNCYFSITQWLCKWAFKWQRQGSLVGTLRCRFDNVIPMRLTGMIIRVQYIRFLFTLTLTRLKSRDSSICTVFLFYQINTRTGLVKGIVVESG